MDLQNTLLTVDKLSIVFHLRQGTLTAVEDASFQITNGSIVGMVGESGCGKSVTCRALLRIEAPGRIEAGTIQYHRPGHDVINIHQLDPRQDAIRSIRWKEIAMIFQEPMTSFGPMHTIGNQIGEAIRLHLKVDQKQVESLVVEALKSVGMPRPEQMAQQYPHQMSGGMRQRAMIAMALSCNPNLLIADEPTTALDVTTEAQILGLLKERQQALNMTILYITHNLAVLSQIAEHIMVMYLGRIVETASAQTLFQYPKHPYTQALMKSIPRIDSHAKGRLEIIKGDIPELWRRPSGCAFHPRCSQCIDGVCDKNVPSLIKLKDGAEVACHLYTN